MASMNMLEFFTEDITVHPELHTRSSRFSRSLEDGYSVCSSCGMEIVFEHDHPGFDNCPACGSELLK